MNFGLWRLSERDGHNLARRSQPTHITLSLSSDEAWDQP